MTPFLPRWTKWVAYPCFAMVAFLIFFYATFPYDRVKRLIEGRLSVPGKQTVQIGRLGPKIFTGLSARDVVIRVFPAPTRRHPPDQQPRARADGRMPPGPEGQMPAVGARWTPPGPEGQKPPGPAAAETPTEPDPIKPERIVLDEVAVKVGIWRLIWRKGYDVDFFVAGFAGEIEGEFSFRLKEKAILRVEAKGLDLSRVPMVASTIGVPVAGKFSANIELDMPRNWLPRANGKVELSCEGCSIGDGKGKLKIPGNPFLSQGLTIPKIDLGQTGGRIAIKRGVGRFENFAIRSDDLELELSGSVRLGFPIGSSALQAFLRFQIGRALKDRAKNIPFDLLEGSLAGGKMNDGFYGLSLFGALARPQARLSTVPPRS